MSRGEENNDGHIWSTEGRNILTSDNLAAIRHVLKETGPIIVEHWFYYGSRCPDRFVFDDYDELMGYLESNARAGDAFHIWSFAQVCKDDNTLANGKYPDQKGRVPNGGAY